MRRMSRAADGRSGGAFGRRGSARVRMAVALGVSALFHAALLAWGALVIPEGQHAARGVERPGAAAEPAPERVIEMVRIQPPGVLPSGGSAGSSEGASAGAATAASALPTELPPVSVRTAGTAAGGPVMLAAAPVSPLALPAVGDLMAAAPASNRGILRRRPESGAFPGRGDRWTSSTSGRGAGGGGLTISGVGTDCITAGSGGRGTRTGFGLPGSGRGWGPGGAAGGGRLGGWPRG